jgi:hypothetical protein
MDAVPEQVIRRVRTRRRGPARCTAVIAGRGRVGEAAYAGARIIERGMYVEPANVQPGESREQPLERIVEMRTGLTREARQRGIEKARQLTEVAEIGHEEMPGTAIG